MVLKKTSLMQKPTPPKTTKFTATRAQVYGSARVKNQFTGTLANIAKEPKLTVANAARSLVDASSFEPSAPWITYSAGRATNHAVPAAAGARTAPAIIASGPR